METDAKIEVKRFLMVLRTNMEKLEMSIEADDEKESLLRSRLIEATADDLKDFIFENSIAYKDYVKKHREGGS